MRPPTASSRRAAGASNGSRFGCSCHSRVPGGQRGTPFPRAPVFGPRGGFIEPDCGAARDAGAGRASAPARACRIPAKVLCCPAVTPTRLRLGWQAPALLLAGLAALYAGALGNGFLNDDYLLLEQARRHNLLDALAHPSGLGNFFRPLAREVWFALVGPLLGREPLLFHVVQ